MNWFTFVSGLLFGALFGGTGVLIVTRRKLIVENKVAGDFEEVCRRLEEAIRNRIGWEIAIAPVELSEKLEADGQKLKNIRRVRNYYICNPSYSALLLDKFPFVSSILPCDCSVYENRDGEVYLAQVNVSLLSKIFLGNAIGSIMGRIGRDEKKMVDELKSG